ncbi:MAG TPA: glutamate synthase [Betaproteobacteria bacterium]|nr:glutamate synthase [Betaproteobacteria bacterium]
MASLTLPRSGYALPGTSLHFKTGSWRVQKPLHHHRNAPCHAACPAGEDAQAYLAQMDEGHPEAAWKILAGVNPLPAVTGRVCHHPCETACNRSHYDEAVAIHHVERFLGDEAIRHGWRYPVSRPKRSAPQAAVVGAGPAGLSAAYHLIRLGYQAILFDQLPEAGGILRTALPAYRLPRDILDAEIERLLGTGVHFHPQHKLGRDMSLDELRADYAAVFLAPGNQQSREWSIDGAVQRDLHVGLDLLQEWVAVGTVPHIRSAAIVGGGNTAVDLSRILKRAGVTDVHVVTHQALPGVEAAHDAAMSAIPREITQAIEEGVIFHPYRGIRRLILRGEKVVGIELVHMKKLSRENGESRTVAFEGTETVLHVDQVIPAIGQEIDPAGMESLLRQQPFLTVDAWGQIAGQSNVFGGGDARQHSTGTVSGAIGDGRRAAIAIDNLFRAQDAPASGGETPLPFDRINLHYYERAPRQTAGALPVDARKGCEEIEQGLSANQVSQEARRCFSCGNCLACDNCWTLCPDEAVLKTQELARDGSHYIFDYDYCKGCGLCAQECPCGFIVMEEEL